MGQQKLTQHYKTVILQLKKISDKNCRQVGIIHIKEKFTVRREFDLNSCEVLLVRGGTHPLRLHGARPRAAEWRTTSANSSIAAGRLDRGRRLMIEVIGQVPGRQIEAKSRSQTLLLVRTSRRKVVLEVMSS